MKRDGNRCKVTGNMGALEGAHLVAFQINSTTGRVELLNKAFAFPLALFGQRFADYIQELLGGVAKSDRPWNILVLNKYLHGLFDTGFVGFRPLKITRQETIDTSYESENQRSEVFTVYFSIHWLAKTMTEKGAILEITRDTLKSMSQPTSDFAENALRYQDSYAITNEPVREGDEFSVEFENLEDAKRMFAMFQLRWAASMIQYFAGAAGIVDEEIDDESDNESEGQLGSDAYLQQREKRIQRLFERWEYLQTSRS